MTALIDLWMPIVASALVVFILSALAWTALPHHKGDVKHCPQQDGLTDAIKSLGIAPGNYMFPCCENPKDHSSDEFKAVNDAGPWGSLNLWSAKPNMGKNLGLTFILVLVISVMVGYITGLSRHPGAEFAQVFRVATTVAFMCHVLGGGLNGIWFGKSLRFFITDAVDGLVYSFATGAIFAWFWPAANAPSIMN